MSDTQKTYKFSDQAIGAFAMTLLKGLAEGVDVTHVFRDFDIVEQDGMLYVENVPTATFAKEDISPEEMN